MVWACHLTKRWECPITFGRKFLEIYVIRLQNTPLKFVSTRFRVRLYFVNEKQIKFSNKITFISLIAHHTKNINTTIR